MKILLAKIDKRHLKKCSAFKSILANPRAVFRSGDTATFTLTRRASWEEFHQSGLKVIEDG